MMRKPPDVENLLREHGDAPRHEPGFEARLWEAVDAEDRRVDDAATDTLVARQRRRLRWPAWVAAAASAALIAAAVLGGTRAVHQLRQPPTASAAEVVARMRASLQKFTTVRATVVTADAPVEGPTSFEPGWTSADWFARADVSGPAAPASDPVHIVATADGRLRTMTPVNGAEYSVTYGPDGKAHVERTLPDRINYLPDVAPLLIDTVDDARGVGSTYSPAYRTTSMGVSEQAYLTTGMPLGPPDTGTATVPSAWFALKSAPLSVLSVLANGSVAPARYDGRPALVLSADVVPGPVVPVGDEELMFYGQFDRIEVTVDEATWFPVRFTELLHGRVVSDTRLTDLHLDVPVAAKQFTPRFPAGAKIEVDPQGFARTSLARAARRFPYSPFAAGRLPRGFRFFRAAVAPTARFFVQTGPGDVAHEFWIKSHAVTEVQYRSGFLALTITTRSQRGMHHPLLPDPFATDPTQGAAPGAPDTVTINGGALDGATARVAMPPLGVPHLWAFHEGLLVTVAGDLTRAELLDVASALRRLR
jgi:hypothetical protein